MRSSYIILLLRNLLKNRFYNAIVILSFTIGITCLTLSFNYLTFETDYESFQKDHESIYRIVTHHYIDNKPVLKMALTPFPTAPVFQKELKHVIKSTRFRVPRGIAGEFQVTHDTVSFQEDLIYFSDHTFFELFTFPFIKGGPEHLKDSNTVVITEKIAKKYFANEEALNKILKITNKRGDLYCKVIGIVKDIPENTHLQFSLIVSLPTYLNIDGERFIDNWSHHSWYTYVKLSPNVNVQNAEKNFTSVIKKHQDEYTRNNFDLRYLLERVDEVQFNTDHKWDLQNKTDKKKIHFIFLVGLITFIISWINYINLTSNTIVDRGKELSVRKFAGSTKKQIFALFLADNAVVTLISFAISIILTILLNPVFEQFVGREIPLIVFQKSFNLFVIYIVLFLASIFSCSLYQYFIAISLGLFQNFGRTLKSNIRHKFNYKNALLIIQFSFAVFFSIGTLVVVNQIDFLSKQDLGFDGDKVFVIRRPIVKDDSTGFNNFEKFISELEKLPDVALVARSNEIPGKTIEFAEASNFVSKPENQQAIYRVYVDQNFFKVYGIASKIGKYYSPHDTFNTKRVIINEQCVKDLGGNMPLDQVLNENFSSTDGLYKIQAVIKDYHQVHLKEEVQPTSFYFSNNEFIDYISIRLTSTDYKHFRDNVQRVYKHFYPNAQLETFIVNEYFNRQYIIDRQFSKMFRFYACIASLLLCFGVLGFNKYFITNRMKEIGIRKAVGAGKTDLSLLLIRPVIVNIVLSCVISWPITYYVMQKWLMNYSYRIELNGWHFLLGGGGVFILSLLSVSYYTILALRESPSVILRYE